MKRVIHSLTLHCSDSDVASHDNIETIREWHLLRGFKDIGYHFLITKNGGIFIGRKISLQGAHVKGHNRNSIGICLTGRHEFSKEQFKSLNELINNLLEIFNLDRSDVLLHHDLNPNKTCPNFSMKEVIGH